MTMITPSYLGETIEYSSLHACRSTLEDPTTNAWGLGSIRRASKENLLAQKKKKSHLFERMGTAH